MSAVTFVIRPVKIETLADLEAYIQQVKETLPTIKPDEIYVFDKNILTQTIHLEQELLTDSSKVFNLVFRGS